MYGQCVPRGLRFTRARQTALWIIIAVSLSTSGCANFAQVDHAVYRSAQPTGAQLLYWSQEHGIRSVLNLRGEGDTRIDYLVERAVCESAGLRLYNLPLSARRAPTVQEIEVLASIFWSAPKPILVHCKSGSDRTGLAVAVYLMFIRGRTSRSAVDEALSWRYGHLRFVHPELSAYLLEHYE